jgi:hypothetical protein
MISAKVTKNFDLRKINLDLHREINQGVKIVKDDIERGIDNGSQFGKRFKDIDEKTAKRKGHNRPLIDKGILKDADKMQVTEATPANQEATILPAPDRVDVSFWNHFGTDNIDPREHWGVSDRAYKKIIKNMENTIRKSIDRIRRARIA